MRRRSSPRCSGRCVRGNKPANLADCYANNNPVQSTLRPCRGGNARKCADIRRMRYLADARWDGRVRANAYGQVRSLKYTKTLPPVDGRVSMLQAVTRQPLTWCGWSGQPRGTRGRGRRRSSGRPCAAAPERHSSAGNGLGGLGLPVCAARMSIRARGLVLRQCHCVSSVSFERLSLSVQYLNLCSVQTAKPKQNPNKTQAKSVLFAVYSLPSSWAFSPSKAAKRISVTS